MRCCDPSKVGDTPILEVEFRRCSDNSVIDVSGATTKTIYVTKPAAGSLPAVTVALAAVYTTDGTDGKIRYAMTPLDNRPGVWRYEGFVILSPTVQYTGKETTFTVTRSKFGDSQ